MAVDMFLKITEIPGESSDAKHKDEIEIVSFSFGESNSTSSTGGGGGVGKVAMQDFHFVARTSKASPRLFLHCANGAHIKEAFLTVRRAGDSPVEFVKWRLTDLLVSSYQQAGADDGPSDQFSLNFAKIEVEYTPVDERGSPGEPIRAGWDLKADEPA
jgi:type VI secretion system secreted protein Hcp